MQTDEERRAEQSRQQEVFNDALAFWLPIGPYGRGRGYAPPTVRMYEFANWHAFNDVFAVATRTGHDPGDEDVHR